MRLDKVRCLSNIDNQMLYICRNRVKMCTIGTPRIPKLDGGRETSMDACYLTNKIKEVTLVKSRINILQYNTGMGTEVNELHLFQ